MCRKYSNVALLCLLVVCPAHFSSLLFLSPVASTSQVSHTLCSRMQIETDWNGENEGRERNEGHTHHTHTGAHTLSLVALGFFFFRRHRWSDPVLASNQLWPAPGPATKLLKDIKAAQRHITASSPCLPRDIIVWMCVCARMRVAWQKQSDRGLPCPSACGSPPW